MYHVAYLKYIHFLFVSYTSIKLFKKNGFPLVKGWREMSQCGVQAAPSRSRSHVLHVPLCSAQAGLHMWSFYLFLFHLEHLSPPSRVQQTITSCVKPWPAPGRVTLASLLHDQGLPADGSLVPFTASLSRAEPWLETVFFLF